MRAYEKLAVVAFPGAVVAYLAGTLTARAAGAFAALTVTLVLTVAALYLGWIWAGKGAGQ